MTAAFDHVTLLAVRIAAARLDPAVDSETFVWLLQRFAAAIVRDVERANAPPAADDDDDLLALSAAAEPPASLSQERVAAATGGAASNATTATPGKSVGGAPEASESAAATHAAGTPTAPSSSGPGAAGPSCTAALTEQQCKQLCDEYLAARAANGSKTPPGWVKQKAEHYGVKIGAIYAALHSLWAEKMGAGVATHQRVAAANPKPAAPPPPAKAASTEPDEIVHTETPACWCRRKRASRENVWCKLRLKVRRVEGTRY